MELRFNVTGTDRKRLAAAISEYTGEKAEYQFMPTCAYVIGNFTLSKEGTLSCEDGTDVTALLEKLTADGFTAEYNADPITETESETAEEESHGIAIQIPMAGFTETALQNLHTLVEAKGSLIKKALGVNSLPINQIDDRLDFPWFAENTSPEELNAYMHFVTALCDMAKKQKRITAKEKETDNEKYVFRCFLLRLGFIGTEYKTERKILLRNLTGSSAFKGGR
ncbi:MAG: virulence protein, partial [Clostridia bacterium]|nr:virulence protein [Clostridia bacterium]